MAGHYGQCNRHTLGSALDNPNVFPLSVHSNDAFPRPDGREQLQRCLPLTFFVQDTRNQAMSTTPEFRGYLRPRVTRQILSTPQVARKRTLSYYQSLLP